MNLLFQVHGLTIRRGRVRILQKIDWTVNQGEHWAVLGANGSGKTSLLKAITGYMTPTEGEITLLGETFGETDWRELRQRIGVVSASISHLIHDEDEAVEIVAGGKKAMIGYWGRITPAERAQALRLLSLLRIRHVALRPWEVLSQGERQRTLIARALMANPHVLILDEPCAGLDPVARAHFLEDLRAVARKKDAPGLVLVTHHIEEIVPEFSHVLALRQGRVIYAGPKQAGLTSARISEIFGAPLSVRQKDGHFHLSQQARGRPSSRRSAKTRRKAS